MLSFGTAFGSPQESDLADLEGRFVVGKGATGANVRLVLLGHLEEDLVEFVIVLVNWVLDNVVALYLAL